MSAIKRSVDTQENNAIMASMLKQLAACDSDRAIVRNEVGFSKAHVWAGHALAEKDSATWDNVESRLAWEVLNYYKNTQCPNFADIIEPLPVDEETKEEYHATRKANEAKAKQDSLVKSFRTIKLVGNELQVSWGSSTVKDPEFNAIYNDIKNLNGRRFSGTDKCWYVQATSDNCKALLLLQVNYQFNVSENAQDILFTTSNKPVIEQTTTSTVKTVDASKTATIKRLNQTMLSVALPFSVSNFTEKKDKVKALAQRGKPFDGLTKTWNVPVQNFNAVLAIFPDAIVSDELKSLVAPVTKAQAQVVAEPVQVAPKVDIKIDGKSLDQLTFTKPDGKVIKLLAHQISGIEQMIEQKGNILADDMGLGKTLTTLVVAKYFAQQFNYKIVVVAPASLQRNWQLEASMVGINPEIYSWAKQPVTVIKGKTPKETQYIVEVTNNFILIADESHYAQDPTSNRTKAFNALSQASNCQAVYDLSGTPMPNGRPVNMYSQLRSINHPIASNKSYYEKRYCGGRQGRFGWINNEAHNLVEFHNLIKDRVIRRTKLECLDLPAKTRVLRRVDMSPTAEKAYKAVYNELKAQYFSKNHKNNNAESIVMLNALRQASSIAKLEQAIELTNDLLEANQSVVLFTEFKETARSLAKAFQANGVGLITGDANDQQIEEYKQAFQSKQIKVMICTFKRGGVGHTLTASSNVILLDRPWTPGACIQAEDRLHRIGQFNPVTATWLQNNGLDDRIDNLLVEKANNIDLAMQGENTNQLEYARMLNFDITSMASEILEDLFAA